MADDTGYDDTSVTDITDPDRNSGLYIPSDLVLDDYNGYTDNFADGGTKAMQAVDKIEDWSIYGKSQYDPAHHFDDPDEAVKAGTIIKGDCGQLVRYAFRNTSGESLGAMGYYAIQLAQDTDNLKIIGRSPFAYRLIKAGDLVFLNLNGSPNSYVCLATNMGCIGFNAEGIEPFSLRGLDWDDKITQVSRLIE